MHCYISLTELFKYSHKRLPAMTQIPILKMQKINKQTITKFHQT